MPIFKREKTTAKRETATFAQAQKRLSKLPNDDLLNWADQAGSGMARGLQDYRSYGSWDSLQEIETGLESLRAIVDLLQARHRD